VVTNLAVLEVKDNAFYLLERAPGVSVEVIQNATEGTLIVNGEIPEMAF
jgi:3-oxoacid CoA-transferase subunit B